MNPHVVVGPVAVVRGQIAAVQSRRAAIGNQILHDIELYGFVEEADIGGVQPSREQARAADDDDDQQYPRAPWTVSASDKPAHCTTSAVHGQPGSNTHTDLDGVPRKTQIVHHLTTDEVLLDDALRILRRHTSIPRPSGIHDGDRPAGADAQALALGPITRAIRARDV